MISDRMLSDAVDIIAGTPGLTMNADDLVDDVVLLAHVWTDEEEFMAAIISVSRAMEQLIAGRVAGVSLKYDLSEWKSYHFQHRRTQGAKADTRIVYCPTDTGILVKGFGDRHRPQDFYRRIIVSRT